METNTKVCHMILQKVMEDPQSGSCLNLSYADVTGPVANFNPTGSPYATKNGNSSIFSQPMILFRVPYFRRMNDFIGRFS